MDNKLSHEAMLCDIELEDLELCSYISREYIEWAVPMNSRIEDSSKDPDMITEIIRDHIANLIDLYRGYIEKMFPNEGSEENNLGFIIERFHAYEKQYHKTYYYRDENMYSGDIAVNKKDSYFDEEIMRHGLLFYSLDDKARMQAVTMLKCIDRICTRLIANHPDSKGNVISIFKNKFKS